MDINTIKSKVAELSQLSGKHLLPGFGEDDDCEEQITQLTQEISRLFKECERRMKEMSSMKNEGTRDEAVRKNIECHVAQQLQDLSLEFRRDHKKYLSKLKGQTIEEFRPDLKLKQQGGTAPSASTFFDDDVGESCADPRFSAAQTLQLVMAERMTEEREKAINQVAESVTELAEIFKEIQVLVIDQGSILDRIDFNIEQAADRVGGAVTELAKANEYQKRSRTMLCIYLLLLLCGIMVIVLILKKTL